MTKLRTKTLRPMPFQPIVIHAAKFVTSAMPAIASAIRSERDMQDDLPARTDLRNGLHANGDRASMTSSNGH